MIRIVFSNRTEQLLASLASDLQRFRADRGPWEAPNLVFPNPGVRDYVLRGLAQSDLKVCANMQTNYLEGFWRRFVPAGEPALRLLDRMAIQGILLGLLQDEALLREATMAPVRGYLTGEPRETKALQLAEALARVFEAYSLGRQEWLDAWKADRSVNTHAPEGMEAWQRRLWFILRAKLEPLPEAWMTLTEFFQGPHFERVTFPGEVFFFGLGPFAQAYHDVFRRLGQSCQVNLYVTTPCREIWDDLKDEWNQHAVEEDPFATDTRAHLALQRWGKPGREQVCQLCRLTDWDVDMATEEAGGTSLLHRLQDEILTLGTGESSPLPPVVDDSIRILTCPNPRRETEAVANDIWETLIAAKNRMRFSDIAVILPEAAKEDYLDHLRVAFAETRQIPWHLADQGPNLIQELADGAIQLLKLGLSDLNRAQMLRTLGHPALTRRWPDLPLDELPEFCERAGIVARMDQAETNKTYLEHGLWTWTRGFQRTALGFFTGSEGSLGSNGDTLPAALPLEGSPDLALFLRALLADVRRLRTTHQGPRAWAAQFREFLHAYLGQPEKKASEAEARAMTSLAKALDRMEALEVPGLTPPLLGCREAVAVAEASFQRLLAEALGQFGRGVSVAAHGALRGIPFKAVFLMGMGEGVFPASDTRDPLDLRIHRRKAGDVNRPELDRYLFLESLISARERLVLSYVARDSITGEELQASPLILDLRDILLPALGKEGWQALHVQHRTHRHDLGYFPDLDLEGAGLPPNHNQAAREEAEALWIGERLRQAAGGFTEMPGSFDQWGLSVEASAALSSRIRSCGPLGSSSVLEPLPKRMTIRMGALRKWLECQIQGGAMLRLGLRSEDECDPAEVAEEPFGTGFLDLRGAVRAALWESLASGGEAETVFKTKMMELREGAKSPAGFLAEGEIAAAMEKLNGWAGLISKEAKPCIYRFGPDRSRSTPSMEIRSFEPVEVEIALGGEKIPCFLEGATEPQIEGTTLMLAERKLADPGKPPEIKDCKDLLRAWFDQLLLAAQGIQEGEHRAKVFAWRKGESQVRLVKLPPVTQEEAKEQLANWIQEAFVEPRWTLMPIEAVLELWDQGGPSNAQAMGDWLDKQEEGEHSSFSSMYGPLPRAVEAPVEPEWERLAKERLGLFPEWSTKWEAAQ